MSKGNPKKPGRTYAAAFQTVGHWFVSIYAPAGVWIRLPTKYPNLTHAADAIRSYGFTPWHPHVPATHQAPVKPKPAPKPARKLKLVKAKAAKPHTADPAMIPAVPASDKS